MIKLIATDMDGTFLDSNKKFDKEFIDIFYQLKEKGIKFVIASGNQYYRLYQKFLPLSEQMYFIAENGSYIAEGSRELYSNIIDKQDVESIKKVVNAHPEVFYILCGRKGAYVHVAHRDKESVVKMYYCNYAFVESYGEIVDDIIKIAVYDEKGNILQFFNQVQAQLPKHVKVVTAGNEWMDIQNKEINKGIGIQFLQMIYEIAPEECMAFGDQMNDYELLQHVKYGYAMANAIAPIKEIAYATTVSNDEQGVLKVIKEQVLQKY